MSFLTLFSMKCVKQFVHISDCHCQVDVVINAADLKVETLRASGYVQMWPPGVLALSHIITTFLVKD